MHINVAHHIDKSDPDENGMYDYYYEYDIYEFSEGGQKFFARSYIDESSNAHFLSTIRNGETESEVLNKSDMQTPMFRDAVAYLKAHGKTSITFLCRTGYQDVIL